MGSRATSGSFTPTSLGAQVPQQRITDELLNVVYAEASHPIDALALIVLALEMLDLEGNETACAMLQNAASALEKTTGFASESFSSAVRIEH